MALGLRFEPILAESQGLAPPAAAVTPAAAKSYAVGYRVGSGPGAPKRRLTIGKHGSPWTPETARAAAKRLLAEVAAGCDPAAARQEDRKSLAFNELIDLYLAEGVAHKKPSTLRVDRGRIEHHLRPLIGKLRADRVTRADVERMRDAVSAGRTAEKIASGEKRPSGTLAKGRNGAAAQCVTAVSAIFSFAIERGLPTDNPARGVKKAPVRKLERFLSEAEIARLAVALDTKARRTCMAERPQSRRARRRCPVARSAAQFRQRRRRRRIEPAYDRRPSRPQARDDDRALRASLGRSASRRQ
jgi:hypothetical protein